MKSSKEKFIPALHNNWLTPLYDPLLKWGMREKVFKSYLTENSHLEPGQKVLDLGCGTGTLSIQLKKYSPQIELIGLDADPAVLQIAKNKAAVVNVDIQWVEGLAHHLEFPDNTFDRVISCLMVHHLTLTNKLKAFEEVFRVLKPGGEFHLLDFGKPTNLGMRLISIPIVHMEEAGDNIRALLPGLMLKAGLFNIIETRHFKTIFGELICYQSIKQNENNR
jgi:ubiquinone/menaquinone biosynthesis C-methylase UbiE